MTRNKFFALLLAVALSGAMAVAESLSDGFYRVQNLGSGRFLYVRDCTGSISTLGAELGALELWTGVSKTLSDPSSVMYLRRVNGSQWDILSQGTGVHEISGYYLTITETKDGCMLYASGQYLYEIGTSTIYPDLGLLGAKTSDQMPGKARYRIWPAHRITNTGNDFFGAQPYLQRGNRYYTTFYADFGYSPIDDVRSSYVSHVDYEHAIAVIRPISGTVARRQPVILDCPGNTPASNRLNLIYNAGVTATGNSLSGVYFCNGERSGFAHSGNPAYVEFNPSTMRMLELDSRGQLVFTNAPTHLQQQEVKKQSKWVKVSCIPANQAYLQVNVDCPAVLRVMNESDYRHYIDSITPVVTTDTVFSLVGSITRGEFRYMPFRTTLAIDSLVTMRVARVVSTSTRIGSAAPVVVRDTLWLGGCSSAQQLTRSNVQGGFAFCGDRELSLLTDADGSYTIDLSDNQRLLITFPSLPVPEITRDTTYRMTYGIGNEQIEILPGQPYSYSLPIDTTVQFRFSRIIRTYTRVGSRPITEQVDTTLLGAPAGATLVVRELAAYPLSGEEYYSLTTDAGGRYTWTLLSDSQFTIAFPPPPVPVISYDTVYYMEGNLTNDQWLPLSQRMVSMTLPIDSSVHFRFHRVVETRTVIETRPAVYRYDTLLLGAPSASAWVVREQASYPLSGGEYYSLTTDASGRYTWTIQSDSLFSVTFPAPPVPGITRDTLYYIESSFSQFRWQALSQRAFSMTLPIDSLVHFRFHRVVETRTIIETRPAVYQYDTVVLGASASAAPVVREQASYSLSGEEYYSLTTDAGGRYIWTLLSDSQFSVTFPAPPVPVITHDTVYYMEGSFIEQSWQPLSQHMYSVVLPIDSLVRFRFHRVVETRTVVETRPAVYRYDTLLMGAPVADAPVVREQVSYPLFGEEFYSLQTDADGRYSFLVSDSAVLKVTFPEVPIPVVVSDTDYYFSTVLDSFSELLPIPCAVTLPIDSFFTFSFVRTVQTSTTVGSRQPVLSYDTVRVGADIPGVCLSRQMVSEGYVLRGNQPLSFLADADGRFVFSIREDSVLTMTCPDLPIPSYEYDTTNYIACSLTDWEMQPMPCRMTLLQKQTVDLQVLQVIQTTTYLGSRQPALTYDTLALGADRPDVVLYRDSFNLATLPLTGIYAVRLTADVEGLYVFSLSDRDELQVLFPEFPSSLESFVGDRMPVDGCYDVLGRRVAADWQSLPAGLYIFGRTKILKQ